jgi:hypothetical protein
MISTYVNSVSINFIHNSQIEAKNKKSANLAQASKQSRIDRKNKTEEEIKIIDDQKKEDQKKNKIGNEIKKK